MMRLTDPKKADMIIYHANCTDGFGAAWAAWKLLGDGATYHPVHHKEPPPSVLGRNVVLVDFCYSRDTMLLLESEAQSILVLDHHKSSQADMAGLPFSHFDMNHSGAALSWMFFHPNKPTPQLIQLIEDRDLWNWKLPLSKEFSAAFGDTPHTFQNFDAFLNPEVITEAQVRGSYILDYNQKVVERLCKRATVHRISGLTVAVVNSPILGSEIGSVLAEEHDFSIVWWWDHRTKQVRASLRSRPDGADVSEIARRWGGGGHRAASGMSLGPGVSIETIFDALPEMNQVTL